MILSLLVNFVGDGLRDAFDPRQKRIRFSKVKDLPEDAVVESGTTADVPEGVVMTTRGIAANDGVSSDEPDGPIVRGGGPTMTSVELPAGVSPSRRAPRRSPRAAARARRCTGDVPAPRSRDVVRHADA